VRDSLVPRVPLLVKIAPDLSESEIDDALSAISSAGLDGIIATNTTIGRDGIPDRYRDLKGGLSGAPLRDRSTAVIRYIAQRTEGHLPIVGVGGIGAEAARLASAFGMRVLGLDARRESPPPGVAQLHPPEALDELLPQADFVILTVPHTPATEGFFGRARFRRMKPTAFFINIGRGRTVRLDDLTQALRAGEIAGAGLDVFETEPLPAEHPLWTLPGVIITPHTAGFGPHLNERRYDIIEDNCRRFMAGRTLRNIVDKQHWF